MYISCVCPIKRANLSDHRDELLGIYSRISNSGSRTKIAKRIDTLIDTTEGSFKENRSRINSAFTKALGESLAKPYLISGIAGEAYQVELPRDRVVFLDN